MDLHNIPKVFHLDFEALYSHRSEIVLLQVFDVLLLATDKRDFAILVLLNFTFNTVNHTILLSCLEHLSV